MGGPLALRPYRSRAPRWSLSRVFFLEPFVHFGSFWWEGSDFRALNFCPEHQNRTSERPTEGWGAEGFDHKFGRFCASVTARPKLEPFALKHEIRTLGEFCGKILQDSLQILPILPQDLQDSQWCAKFEPSARRAKSSPPAPATLAGSCAPPKIRTLLRSNLAARFWPKV